MIQAFSGDAHISFEGDLSKLRWRTDLKTDPRAGRVLSRQTSEPVQDYVILPLVPETIPQIRDHVLPVIGLKRRVAHIQIEQHGELVFTAIDWFHEGHAWVAECVGQQLLDSLLKQGCLKSYRLVPDPESRTTSNPAQYLAVLVREEDVRLNEAVRAFGGDAERARKVLKMFVENASVFLVDENGRLLDWRAKEILRDPDVFSRYGEVCMRSPDPD